MRSIRSFIMTGLLLALALPASAAWTAPAARPSQPTGRAARDRMTIADLDRGLASSPGASTMAAVKRYYPHEYAALLEEMLARVKASDGSFSAAHLIGAE